MTDKRRRFIISARDTQALRLRLAGETLDEIAAKLGVKRQRIDQMIGKFVALGVVAKGYRITISDPAGIEKYLPEWKKENEQA